MRRLKILGLCLVAVFALGALAATVAQAEGPEWGRCLHVEPEKGKEVKKGNYEDPNCQKVAMTTKKGVEVPSHKGAYEWYGGAKQYCGKQKKAEFKYKDKACSVVAEKKGVPDNKGKYEWGPGAKFTAVGGAGVLNATFDLCRIAGSSQSLPRKDCTEEGKPSYFAEPVARVECTSERATGEAVGTDEVADVSVRFTGCAFSGTPATTTGLPAGEIQVNQLKGRLGYIDKAKSEVGVLLEPATPGGQFAVFTVEEGNLTVHVGVGNATEGSFYEEFATPGVPNGHDGLISPITPVDQMTHTFTQNYRGEELKVPCPESENCSHEYATERIEFRNVPTSFEGGPVEALEAKTAAEEGGIVYEATAWGAAGEELTNTNTVEGEVEIKA